MRDRPAHARANVEAGSGSGGASIRPARADDIPDLLALENSAFVGDRLSRRSLARFVGRPTGLFLVACVGGRLAGYILLLLHARRRAVRVYSLAVAVDFAGRGIGRALVAAGCEAARDAGRDRVTLEVRTDNVRAIDLYHRCGFTDAGLVCDYYEDGASALKMVRPIAEFGGALP